MNISATRRLVTKLVITVIGIARIKLPKIPPTNNNGAKLKAAVKVAATIARLILPVATCTVSRGSLRLRRWASIASIMIIVSSTMSAKHRMSENRVMVLSE